ncbi:MAG TPA: AAA family ATPase, partial [Haliangium sp.]|nr:AAA family ATPase [Haliangium sp.]
MQPFHGPWFHGMIIQLRVANFRSLRDEQTLSMVASTRADTGRAARAVPGAPVTALCAAGIFGANASGKSNVLEALRFLCSAVENSHGRWRPDEGVPRTPFCLDAQSPQRPSEFELDFVLDDVRYSYGFQLDDEQILAEWLHAFPQGRRQSWFTREQGAFSFGKKLGGQNRTIASLTRPNSLFLSAAAQNNHEQLMPLYRWLVQSIQFIDLSSHRSDASSFAEETIAALLQSGSRRAVVELLRFADLGILDARVTRRMDTQTFSTYLAKLSRSDRTLLRSVLAQLPSRASEPTPAMPAERFSRFEHDVVLEHRPPGTSGGQEIRFEHESEGTKAWFGLLGPLLHTLRTGGVLLADELDRSLHPHLVSALVHMFQNPRTNPRCAQLIFNTHDTSLIGTLHKGLPSGEEQSTVLARDQI